MIRVGLTGGIGSGKTTVSAVFEKLGIAVYNSDFRARGVMSNQVIVSAIRDCFGDVYRQGVLDRKRLGEIVFADSEKLRLLNSIVHPAVAEDFMEWSEQQSSPYVIIESAILFESGFNCLTDKIIVVDAPLEIRIARVLSRDALTRKEAEQRIKAQMGDTERLQGADYVIVADGERLLLPQITDIDASLKNIKTM